MVNLRAPGVIVSMFFEAWCAGGGRYKNVLLLLSSLLREIVVREQTREE